MEGVQCCTSPAARPHDPAATQASYQSSRLNWLSVSEEQQADGTRAKAQKPCFHGLRQQRIVSVISTAGRHRRERLLRGYFNNSFDGLLHHGRRLDQRNTDVLIARVAPVPTRLGEKGTRYHLDAEGFP